MRVKNKASLWRGQPVGSLAGLLLPFSVNWLCWFAYANHYSHLFKFIQWATISTDDLREMNRLRSNKRLSVQTVLDWEAEVSSRNKYINFRRKKGWARTWLKQPEGGALWGKLGSLSVSAEVETQGLDLNSHFLMFNCVYCYSLDRGPGADDKCTCQTL